MYTLTMDASKLSDGDHTFIFRAKNTDGVWGTLYTETFTIIGCTNGCSSLSAFRVCTSQNAKLGQNYEVYGGVPIDFIWQKADINGDGKVNAADVVTVADIIKKNGEVW